MPRGRKPGSKASPRKQLPRDIKAARKLNAIEFERIVNRVLFCSMGNFESLLDRTVEENRENTVIEQMVLSLVRSAIEKGDHTKLEFILNRILGKVADRVQIETVRPVLIEDIESKKTITLSTQEYKTLPESSFDTRLDREKKNDVVI